jgi:hypothetical protein
LVVQSQFTGLICGPVAFDAVLGQKWADFCFKESFFYAQFVVAQFGFTEFVLSQ